MNMNAPKPKNRKPITLDAVKKAFGNDEKRMAQFVSGSRKAYSTGQPQDDQTEADTTARN